jgi:hypothetical protein
MSLLKGKRKKGRKKKKKKKVTINNQKKFLTSFMLLPRVVDNLAYPCPNV